MTDPIRVTDPGDPRVADFVALTDVALRRRVEPAAGLFIAEGELVVRRAVRAGYRMRSLLLAERGAAGEAVDSGHGGHPLGSAAAGDVPVYLAAPAVLAAITGFHVHRGVLAAFTRRPMPAAADVLAGASRVAVVEDGANPTNLGAIFRSAAGLGMDAVLLSPRCADPLYRRAVRVSMGEVFAVPYARLDPWPQALQTVRKAGFRLLALTPDPAGTPLPQVRPAPADRCALLLGAEGPGLSPAAMAAADERVRIPMTHGVDSLNVAAAAAVACYALGRPR